MEWYYAEAGEQRGPVTESEFQSLVNSGKVGPETLVWRDGLSGWQAYGQLSGGAPGAPAAPASEPAPGGGLVCCHCGRPFAPDQVIRVGDRWVCAECKPVFMQQLREGALPGPGSSGAVTREEVLARDYETPVSEYLNQSWALFKDNMGVLIGGAVLVYLVLIAINIIPYLSAILSLIFQGPLMAGLWVFFIRKVRGEDLTASQAFGGFGPRFWQCTLVNVVSGFLAMVPLIPFIVVVVVFAVTMSGQHGGEMSAPGAGLIAAMAVTGLLGFCGAMYLGICWVLALPLVLDKNQGFWQAMELSRKVVAKHFWSTLALGLVTGLLALAGALLCLVGLLFTGPVALLAWALHYQKLFGDLVPDPD